MAGGQLPASPFDGFERFARGLHAGRRQAKLNGEEAIVVREDEVPPNSDVQTVDRGANATKVAILSLKDSILASFHLGNT